MLVSSLAVFSRKDKCLVSDRQTREASGPVDLFPTLVHPMIIALQRLIFLSGSLTVESVIDIRYIFDIKGEELLRIYEGQIHLLVPRKEISGEFLLNYRSWQQGWEEGPNTPSHS